MKKVLFWGAMVVGMIFASSCSKEDFEVNPAKSDVRVGFSLGIEGKIGTRAVAGVAADKLVYSLFDAEGNLLENIGDNGMVVKENAFGGNSESISVSLVKGQTYTVVFWAQNSACDAYTITASKNGLNVDVDYNGLNNDEARDAFFATETFTVEGNTVIDVILKRPFAQINLGVTAEDWDAAVASGINITKSKTTIKNVATSINLLDGSVSGSTDVVYDFADLPSVATRAASDVKTLDIDTESYKWLSMSYILTDESKSTLDSDGLQFTLEASNGSQIVLEEGLHNVPVQRNWRTNVVGNVLTGVTTFNVSVDPVYYSTATVGSVEEFYTALNDHNIQVIKLAPGTYDILHVHRKGSKVIESADPSNPAVIKGVLGVAATIAFNNVNFVASESSLVKTGHQYIDRMERKAVVPIYAAKAKFTGCNFYDLYNSHNVVSINYQAHKKNTMLEIDNCYFEGYAYTIYSRALVSVTNCTFKQQHPTVYPRAIFLYGLGDGSNGSVIFKNNTAIGKTSYAIQMSSSNYDYKNICFDIQGNENFSVTDPTMGSKDTPYLFHPEKDYEGCTFADGSEEFSHDSMK